MRNFSENKENRFLISHVMDLYYRYKRTGKSCASPFLDEAKITLISNYLKRQQLDFSIYQAHENATKKVIYFGTYEDFVTSFRFPNYEGKVHHSDVLGSLFACGLSHEVLGDIFVESDFISFSVLTKAVPIIKEELKMIARYPISLEEHPIVLKEPHEKVFLISTSSMRIDSIVSRIIPCSRSISSMYMKEGRVLLFYQEVNSINRILEEGDILSIRGVGKFRIGKIKNTTKSGKIVLEIIKYC